MNKKNIKIRKNLKIAGTEGRVMLTDIYWTENNNSKKPAVIFSHGFKGFKDWGHWHLIAEKFAEEGFIFIKFNFSFNGTTPENPVDFADLEAFGNNNYSRELNDLGCIIDWVLQNNELPVNQNRLSLIGHSRGGGISLLKAFEDTRVKKVVIWASVADFNRRWVNNIQGWKEKGVVYIENARTKQQMPMYYQMYEDFQTNNQRLDIPSAVKNINIPMLIIHGTGDPAVDISEAKELAEWNPSAELKIIEGAGHTFGGKHPWKEDHLPEHSKEVVGHSVKFLNPAI